MHETRVVERILQEAMRAGASREIRIEVGELSGLTPEEIADGLESSGFRARVSLERNKIKCECGFRGSAKILERGHGYCLFQCPECGKRPEVLKGGEIRITGVD